LSTLVLTYFKGLYFSHFSITQIGKGAYNQSVALGNQSSARPCLLGQQISCFGKFLSFVNVHVEMDLM